MKSKGRKHAVTFFIYCLFVPVILIISSLHLYPPTSLSLKLPSLSRALIQRSPDCSAESNADLYGIGVRIGFYLQSIGSFVGLVLEPEGRLDDLVNTYSLHIALYATIFHSSISQNITPGQVMIGIHLLYMLSYSEEAIILKYTTSNILPEGGVRSVLNHMIVIRSISLCMTCYSIWFWWHGLNILPRGHCGDTTFFFGRVDLYGWFRTFGKCWDVCSLVKLILELLSMVEYRLRNKTNKLHDPNPRFAHPRREQIPGHHNPIPTTETDRDNKPPILFPETANNRYFMLQNINVKTSNRLAHLTNSRHKFILVFVLFSSFSVVAIELGIVWNGFHSINTIESFYSFGQLVPFIVGVVTFANLLYGFVWNLLAHYKQKSRGDKGGTEDNSGKQLENGAQDKNSHTMLQDMHTPGEQV
ncbi:hypothetical protein F5Y11DRAFT_137675 [Daldinia sp. FL1419]|nr:hypothetical protein F5Y11DRAFT_137675 [Daldinia sp. FL1419]